MSEAIWDGSFRLIEYDPLTGRSIWFDYGTQQMRIDYPVDDVVRINAAERNATAGQRFGDWAKVASIPLNLYHDSGLAEAIQGGDKKFISKFLNDSDHRAWRTKEGKI